MAKSSAKRRGVILIEPYKQLRFGLMFLLANLVFSILILSLFSYYLLDIYSTLSVYFELDGSQNVMILTKLSQPAFIGLGLIVLFIATTLFLSVHYTHQIYGPLVSIHRFLEDILEDKKPEPIKLRTSDQLQDLSEKLNAVANKLQS